MSKDPLEELFGISDDGDDSDTQPLEPVPARRRLEQEQVVRTQERQADVPRPAPPVHNAGASSSPQTKPLPSEGGVPRDGSTRGKNPILPWIVVGLVALVAIIGATFLVNALRAEPAPETSGPDSTQTQPEEPSTPVDPEEPAAPEETEEEQPDGPPEVDVGSTYPIPVPQWGISFDISSRLGGSLGYEIQGDNLVMRTTLMEEFPASCEAMRSGWGITKQDDDFALLRPAEACAEAEALYDEVWGLTQAMVDSITPA